MGKERESRYYDSQWQSAKWRKDWNEISRVRTRLYQKASELVPKHAPLVIDLGCVAGHFAQCLQQINRPMAYAGFDFSEAAIHFAKKRCGQDELFSFKQMDLRVATFDVLPPPGVVYVCLEVLEHIQNDLRIFSLIPEGARVIVSVPSFDEPSHVRHFESFDKVVNRYRTKIDFGTVRSSSIWKWHLFTGIRHESTSAHQAQNGELFQ